MLKGWREIAEATATSYRRFLGACDDVERTQFELLSHILQANEASAYGKRYEFKSIASTETYRERVPVVDYDDLVAEIDVQARGESQLCADRVLFFEPTGGSTGGVKLVPYTRASLRAMHRAIEPWLADLIDNRPGITSGPAYWSISPAVRNERNTADGTAIGSPSDVAFLREELQSALAGTLTVPQAALSAKDIESWRFQTLLSLVAEENLRLISVWSPSFLTTLIDALVAQQKQLLNELPQSASARLKRALRDGQLDTRILWPNLDTVSCWAHGAAASQASELAALFPGVNLQPKGLLATEGVVSVPLCAAEMPVLALRSAFFEFADDADHFYLAHELEPGRSYRVVITTYAGLYRYDLGDTVVVHDRFYETPTLEFAGRRGVVSDICGEKLSDAFVSRCLAGITGFATVAPRHRGYRLYVDSDAYSDDATVTLAVDVEQRLGANPQYAYARRVGQLEPLQIVRVRNPADKLLRCQVASGQSLGDIKPAALSLDRDLHGRFGVERP